MATYITVGIASIIVVGLVVLLSLTTLSKGYSYKHSVDPLPEDDKEDDKEEDRKNQ
ncbi:YtzI protein [Oceanobacillus massiliensis]|uniref:YtzI protein n=1 Tax=Oceanobacillus massiliensis TaxID=1465765 RepID=UPI00028942F5|nr:YtzI protein [Oceanobacillus massiliensis]